MRALISIALLQILVVVVVVSTLLMTDRRGSQLWRRRGRGRIVGVELSNLSHLPIRRKTFAPQRDPPGRPFCSDLQRDLFVSGENLSNTAAAAAAANRCEIDRRISKSTTVMILLLLCATRAPLSVLLLLFVTCVCVITQSKATSTATVIIYLRAFSWRCNKTSRRHRFCVTKKMAVLERGSGRCFFFHSGHHRFANPAFVALLLVLVRQRRRYIYIHHLLCWFSGELISFSVEEIAFLSHAWR